MKALTPFWLFMVFLIAGCDKSEVETAETSVKDAVKTGDWMVIYMESNAVVDIGAAFLKFNSNGTLVASKDATTYNGTWAETTSGGHTLTINITTNDVKLQKVNKMWRITGITQYFIDLKDSNASGNASVQLMKH